MKVNSPVFDDLCLRVTPLTLTLSLKGRGDQPPPPMNKLVVRFVLLIAIAFAIGDVRSYTYVRAQGIDFYQWWLLPQVVNHATDRAIYTDANRLALYNAGSAVIAAQEKPSPKQVAAHNLRKTYESYSTPLLYAFFQPFSGMPFDRAFSVYHWFSMCCMIASVLALCRIVGLEWEPALALVLLFLVGFTSLKMDLGVANVTSIQLAGVTAYLWLRTRPQAKLRGVPAGVVLALVVLFKPMTAPAVVCLAAWWLVRKDFQTLREQAIGWAVGGVVGLAISMTLLPARAWIDWLGAIGGLDIPLSPGNLSLYRVLESTSVPWLARALLPAALIGALTLVWRLRGTTDRRAEIVVVGLGVSTVLLSAPLVWTHYFLLTVPLSIWALRPTRHAKPQWVCVGIAMASLLAIMIEPLRFLGMPLSLGVCVMDVGVAALMVVGTVSATSEPAELKAPSETGI